MLGGGMRGLKIASPSSFNIHSRPSDPTFLLGDHDTIINYALDDSESLVLIDVIDNITLAIENDVYIWNSLSLS